MRRGFLNAKKTKDDRISSFSEPQKLAESESRGQATTLVKRPAATRSEGASKQVETSAAYFADSDAPQPPPNPDMWSLVQFLREGISPLFKRMTVMTVPAKVDADGSPYEDPDGHFEFISHADWPIPERFTKPEAIRPIPKTSQRNYEIKKSSTGLGVFATRDIKAYELVFAERPILITHDNQQRVYIAPPPKAAGGKPVPVSPKIQGIMTQHERSSRIAWEKQLEGALGRMKPEDRKAFMDLTATFESGQWGPLSTRIKTNCYGLMGFDDTMSYEMTPEQARKVKVHCAVGKISSRINNSCRPNIVQLLSRDSLCLTFVAARDIKKGEELFYCYTEPQSPSAERQLVFAAYGFRCKCLSCTDRTSQSDQFRSKAYHALHALRFAKDQWIQRDDLLLVEKQALEKVNAFKAELLKDGMVTFSVDAVIAEIKEKVNERKGNKSEATRFRAEKERLERFGNMMYD